MIDQRLKEYIESSLVSGKSKEEIYKELLGQGWTIEVIQENFKPAETKKSFESDKADNQSRTIKIVAIIGAVLIGAGIFSFIASNWEEMTRALKVSVILIAMAISYGAAWFVREKYKMEKTGGALLLLGSIIYGSGIFLVAQMFHIRANWPDGFLLWMLGSLAMGLAMDSYASYRLAIIMGIVAVIGHPFGIIGPFGTFNSFLLTSSFLLLISAVATFVIGIKIRKGIPVEFKDYY